MLREHGHGHVVRGGSVGILLLLLDQVDGVDVKRVVWVAVAVGGVLGADVGRHGRPVAQLVRSRYLFLKHESSIFRQSSNPLCDFSKIS